MDKNSGGKIMALFNQTFEVKGKHANMMRKLVEKLNCRNLDVFYISIVMGLWQNKRVSPDADNKIEPAKIDSEQMVRFNSDIEFLYQLVMLSDKSYEISDKTRVDKAFRDIGKPNVIKDEERFVSYLLGGLEFLYEQIAETTASDEDVFEKIFSLTANYAATSSVLLDELN